MTAKYVLAEADLELVCRAIGLAVADLVAEGDGVAPEIAIDMLAFFGIYLA